jgi:hypothetical protein
MFYRRLADFVVLIHSLIVAFFFVGGFWSWWNPRVALFHLPLALWVTIAFSMGWPCPLTPLENWLRKAAGRRGYAGSFTEQYIAPVFCLVPFDTPSPISRRTELMLGIIFCLLCLSVHAANYRAYAEFLDAQ